MPLRGENVGTAYVRIIADGSEVPDGIRDAMEDATPVVRSAGKDHGEAYGEAFEKQAKKDFGSQKSIVEALRKSVEKGFGEAKVTDAFFKGREWNRFLGSVEKNYGAAGVLAAREMQNKFAERGTLAGFEAEFTQFNSRIAAANKKINEAQNREQVAATKAMLAEAYDLNRSYNARVLKDRQDLDRAFELSHKAAALAERELLDEAYADNKRFNDGILKMRQDMDKAFDISLAEQGRSVEALRQRYEDLEESISRLSKGFKIESNRGALADEVVDLRRAMDDAGIATLKSRDALKDWRRDLALLNPSLAAVNLNLNEFADRVGAGFGRGSRNDFLNFIGGFSRTVALIPRALTATYGAFDGFARRAKFAFDTATEAGQSTARAVASSAGSMIKDIGKLAAGIGGGVAGTFLFVGPLLSTINLAVGAVGALISSVGFGLVGALGAAGGLVLPLVAGLGVLTTAILNVPKAAKPALKSLKDDFASLGEIAGNTVFSNITEQAGRFSGVLNQIEPIVRGVGLSIARVGDYFLDLTDGPGFSSFVASMTDFLPGAVESLGRTLGNTFGGLGGLLRGLIPITEEFLGYLEDASANFLEFTNSARGPSTIAEYFNRAGDSAKRVIDFLGSVSDLLGTILTAGRSTGDSLFASMTNAIDGWNRALESDPAILQRYFEDARRFGEAIGDLVVGVGLLFDELDNSGSRELAIQAFQTLANVLETVAALLTPVITAFNAVNDATGGMAGGILAASLVFPRLAGAISNVAAPLATLGADLRNTETRMSRLGGIARGAAGVGGLAVFAASATSANDSVSLLGQTAGGALMGAAFGPQGALIGGVLGAGSALLSMKGDADAADAAIEELKGTVEEYAATLDSVTGATTEATQALAVQELTANGGGDRLAEYGISIRTAANAALGLASAQKTVNTALATEEEGVAFLVAERAKLTKGIEENIEIGTQASLRQAAEAQRYVDDYTKQIDARRADIEAIREQTNTAKEAVQAKREEIAAIKDYSGLLKGLPQKARTEINADGIIPTTKGVRELAEEYNLTPKQIRTVIEASGADTTVKQVQGIRTLYSNIPKKVVTNLLQNGQKESMANIVRLANQYDLTPKQVRTLIQLDGDKEAKKKIGDVMGELADLDAKKTEARILANNKVATDIINATEKILNGMDGVGGKKIITAIFGENANSVAASREAGGAARLVSDGKYLVRIDGDSSGVRDAVVASNAALSLLDTFKQVTINTINTVTNRKAAAGGLFTNSNKVEIGESGPEMVVPLSRPLAQVDPAVRALSAIAQGKALPGSGTGNGKQVDASNWTIVTNGDPEQTASEVVNRLVATTF